MTQEEIITAWIAEHDHATRIHSVPGPMRRSPTYQKIMEAGEEGIPAILRYLGGGHGGMNIMLLLMDQVKEHPYKPEPVAGGHMAAYTVGDAKEAWLAWGLEKGYLES